MAPIAVGLASGTAKAAAHSRLSDVAQKTRTKTSESPHPSRTQPQGPWVWSALDNANGKQFAALVSSDQVAPTQ